MNKKWIIGISIALGVVVLGVAAYFAWQNRAKIAQVVPELEGGGTIAPVEKTVKKMQVISSREVTSYWVTKDATSSAIFYLDQTGNIIKIDASGVETADTIGLKNALDIVPAPSGNWLFAKLSTSGDAAIYDMVKGARTRDFIGIDAAAWGAEDGKLATIITGTDTGSIKPRIVVEDLKNAKVAASTVLSFGLQGFDLQWPQKDSLFLTQKPSADYISDMWKVDIKTKQLSKFLSDRGLMVQWSPMGDRALKFTTTEGRGHKLAIIDNTGAELMTLRFVTMPDKCVMTTSAQMYCAIPRDQESLSHMILPDDYLKRNVYFKDGIYQIDLANNGIKTIFEDEDPIIDATDLSVLNDKILFINRYDKKLYSLNIK